MKVSAKYSTFFIPSQVLEKQFFKSENMMLAGKNRYGKREFCFKDLQKVLTFFFLHSVNEHQRKPIYTIVAVAHCPIHPFTTLSLYQYLILIESKHNIYPILNYSISHFISINGIKKITTFFITLLLIS